MKNIDVEPIIEDLLEMKACGRECVTIDGMIESLMAAEQIQVEALEKFEEEDHEH